MNTNNQVTPYVPVLVAVIVIALVSLVSNTSIFGGNRAAPTAVATATTYVIVVTPTASLEDQLKALHLDASKVNVPTFTDFKAKLTNGAPVADSAPAVVSAPVNQQLLFKQADQVFVKDKQAWLPCNGVQTGQFMADYDQATWNSLDDAGKSQVVASCES